MNDAGIAPERARWARGTLGITEGQESTARQAFLKRVERESFLPNRKLLDALRELDPQSDTRSANPHSADARSAGTPRPCTSFLEAHEPKLRRKLDRFAASFFKMPLDQREREWNELRVSAAEFPRLLARLDDLRPGLAFQRPAVDAEPLLVRELAKKILEWFVLERCSRIIKRQEFLFSLDRPGEAGWERAAKRVRTVFPRLAALMPELIEGLIDRGSTAKRNAKSRRAYNARATAASLPKKDLFGPATTKLLPLIIAFVGLSYGFFSAMQADRASQGRREIPPTPSMQIQIGGEWSTMHDLFLGTEEARRHHLKTDKQRRAFEKWVESDERIRRRLEENEKRYGHIRGYAEEKKE